MHHKKFAGLLTLALLFILLAIGARSANAGGGFESSNAGIVNRLASTRVLNRAGTAGMFGTETCVANGSYETNRSESHLAVDPTNPNHMLGSSKFFFSATD